MSLTWTQGAKDKAKRNGPEGEPAVEGEAAVSRRVEIYQDRAREANARLKVDRFYFATSEKAQTFMRECDKHGIRTGFPQRRRGRHSVATRPSDRARAKRVFEALRALAS